MDTINSYYLVIGASLIIIISYLFNFISRKSGVPSVLMLIGLGIIINLYLNSQNIDTSGIMKLLELLGIVGLIMIVLEASLDLSLSKEKLPILLKSLATSVIALVICSILIALVFMVYVNTSMYNALFYAIPLAIMSSAIIIPSISSLREDKKEFMIFESTFSDILGIMFFYFLKSSSHYSGFQEISFSLIVNIFLTLAIALVVSYLLIFAFQKITSDGKLFFLIAILILLYAVSKKLHLSALFIILVFGLVLKNRQVFFPGRLAKLINPEMIGTVFKDFKLITLETSFVLRTFFFIVFGMTMVISSLFNFKVIIISLLSLVILYGIRFLLIKLFFKTDIFPQALIAPRGLITILLFFEIDKEYQLQDFNAGIYLFVIIFSSIIMAISLYKEKKGNTLLSEVDPVDEESNEHIDNTEIKIERLDD